MAQDAGGNYVDENSDYSFLCVGCEYWFHDIDLEGKHVPELHGDLCHECLADYKADCARNAHTEIKQEMKITGEYR